MLRYFYAVDEEVENYFWRIQPVIIFGVTQKSEERIRDVKLPSESLGPTRRAFVYCFE